MLHSDYESIGNVKTGNALVNQLISNVEWGMRGNFLDVPTDCPQRDERMGWTGDTQVFSATASYLADSFAFYRKYLYDLYQEQLLAGGMVPRSSHIRTEQVFLRMGRCCVYHSVECIFVQR